MEKTFKFCQSCGMPLKKDEKGGGTNADGTKSLMYCSRCYVDGNFTRPDFTVKQMQELVKGKMKEMGIPGFLTPFFTFGIPKLERWRSKVKKEGAKKRPIKNLSKLQITKFAHFLPRMFDATIFVASNP